MSANGISVGDFDMHGKPKNKTRKLLESLLMPVETIAKSAEPSHIKEESKKITLEVFRQLDLHDNLEDENILTIHEDFIT
jgi:hypothetical protein